MFRPRWGVLALGALLARAAGAYATHMTNVWRARLLPETESNYEIRYLQSGFETWLRQQFADDVGYDKMVRKLITLPFGNGRDAMQAYNDMQNSASPMAFYMAK